MKYVVSKHRFNPERASYLSSIEQLLDNEYEKAVSERDAFMKDFEADIEGKRKEYYKLLGWPLWGYDAKGFVPAASYQHLCTEDDISVYSVTVEVMPGHTMWGLLFRNGTGKKPLVLSLHGGLGTPELCSSLYVTGSANYNGQTKRLLERGVHVFAPQLLLWSKDDFHIDNCRAMIDNQLKQLGGSITALEVYSMMRCVDALSGEDWADETRMGIAGLSYGGHYALFTAAADPRMKCCISSSFFNDRRTYNWNDWTWKNAARTLFDAEVGALIAPRTLCIQAADHDELFSLDKAKAEFERLQGYYRRMHCEDHLLFEAFEGVHEFSKNDVTLDLFFKNL